ncbi:MAG TPA: polysaccharide biosynthesis protein [Symbiobacteriaceae bacterium]
MSRKESLLRGAAALAIAGLIIKLSNLLIRVPLTRLIDTEGIGIYQMSLPAFYALFHLAAGGVPVAVQNLVAEYTAKGRRPVAEQVLRLAISYTATAGVAAAAILLVSAPLLARMLGEPRAYYALVAVAPAIPLFALDAIYRSYLQGRKLMTPSAVAGVLEQATKMAVTLAAAYLLIPLGKAQAAGGAASGITAGAVVSILWMVYSYGSIRGEDDPLNGREESRPLLARRMISLAWPVTLGSVTMPMLNLLDVGIVQRGFLKAVAGAANPQRMATAMYGSYAGIAVQVVWFPVVLTNALGNALVPVLAAAKARGDMASVQNRVLLGIRATGLVCLPVALGLAIVAAPIAALFGDSVAAVPLLYMAPAAYLGPLFWLMTAQLQALGKTGVPMRNFAVGLVVKIGLDALLAPMKGVDIKGVAFASVVMWVVACWLNARALAVELGEPLPWNWLIRGPLLASMVMGGGLFGFHATRVLPATSVTSLLVALTLAPVLYLATLMLTRALTWAEFVEMSGPLGPRLQRWFGGFFTWN